MSELTAKHCKPCEGGVAPYSREQAETLMKQLSSDWVLSKEGPYLRREFRFKDFYRTMSFVNAIAHVANIEDHHPDLEVGYNYCRVQYTTHAIKGLSEMIFPLRVFGKASAYRISSGLAKAPMHCAT